MACTYIFPRLDVLIEPLLAMLSFAGESTTAPTALLPLLSPILRQRVRLLSSSAKESWSSLLCYDDAVASKLMALIPSSRLELHPVSGQVEIDWDSETEIQFKRLDKETLQALVSLPTLDLTVKLVWCVNDFEGVDSQDGWRIGEVGTCTVDDTNWGVKSILLAEQEFTLKETQNQDTYSCVKNEKSTFIPEIEEEKEDDDDKYWDQYDDMSAQTPAYDQSSTIQKNSTTGVEGDDEYYASYDVVQPVLDNHDPDKDMKFDLFKGKTTQNTSKESPIICGPNNSSSQRDIYEAWNENSLGSSIFITSKSLPPSGEDGDVESSGSAVTRPERQALVCEKAIKTHIGTSLKSLYRLAHTCGIGQREFDRLVRNQLDLMSVTIKSEDDI
ncbi:hypothetical protein HI914_02200 [Erysiphe necator]|nr:hypothetical protein HI914_02200 [Erysiphe necator]